MQKRRVSQGKPGNEARVSLVTLNWPGLNVCTRGKAVKIVFMYMMHQPKYPHYTYEPVKVVHPSLGGS